jgi:hypothetical protein
MWDVRHTMLIISYYVTQYALKMKCMMVFIVMLAFHWNM